MSEPRPSAYAPGGHIPSRYSSGTADVLLLSDPDARVWVAERHWIELPSEFNRHVRDQLLAEPAGPCRGCRMDDLPLNTERRCPYCAELADLATEVLHPMRRLTRWRYQPWLVRVCWRLLIRAGRGG